MADTIDWPPPRRPRRRRGLPILLGVARRPRPRRRHRCSPTTSTRSGSSRSASPTSSGRRCDLQGQAFTFFAAVTFLILYGSFLALKPATLGELAGLPILINGQPIKLPVEPVLRLVALGGSLADRGRDRRRHDERVERARALLAGRIGRRAQRRRGDVDPIFGRPLAFYLFTLPAWQLVSGWLMTLAVDRRRDRRRSSS